MSSTGACSPSAPGSAMPGSATAARPTRNDGAMPSIEARLKDLLDETRLAMLGTQLLMGLQYRAAFSPGFDRLPAAFRWLDGVALLLILIAAAILLGTPAFH